MASIPKISPADMFLTFSIFLWSRCCSFN